MQKQWSGFLVKNDKTDEYEAVFSSVIYVGVIVNLN